MSRNKTAAADVATQPTDPAPPPTAAADVPPTPPANGNGKPSSALAVKPAGDLLAALDLPDDAIEDDGLSEVGAEDKKLTILMINFGGKGRDGRNVPRDVYFNTVTETVHESVEAVFIQLHKTREWSRWNEGESKTEVFCKSFDQVVGTMADGTVRPCEGCPDYKWRTELDDKGKERRTRNCSQIYNVASINAAEQTNFLIRFKRTSLPAMKDHMRKFHLDRRPLGGGRMGNYPLYAFKVKLTAKMAHEKAKHAIPVLEHVGVCTRDEILAYAAVAKELSAQLVDMIKRADEIEGAAGGAAEGGDTSFDTAKYDAAVGQDFTPASDAG